MNQRKMLSTIYFLAYSGFVFWVGVFYGVDKVIPSIENKIAMVVTILAAWFSLHLLTEHLPEEETQDEDVEG